MSQISYWRLGFAVFLMCGFLSSREIYAAEQSNNEQKQSKNDLMAADIAIVKTIFGPIILLSTQDGYVIPSINKGEPVLIESDDQSVVDKFKDRAMKFDWELSP